MIWLLPQPPIPLSRQQVISLSQSSCVSTWTLLTGEGREGVVGGAKIIRWRESLVLYISVNTLCHLHYCFFCFWYSTCFFICFIPRDFDFWNCLMCFRREMTGSSPCLRYYYTLICDFKPSWPFETARMSGILSESSGARFSFGRK